MVTIEKFEDIESRKKWRELIKYIYKMTNTEKFSKDWWLKDQIRRASVSILSNIAEWFERWWDKEFKQFLFIAKWSCGEVRTQLYIAHDQGYIDDEELGRSLLLCLDISKLISKFITYLRPDK